MKFLSGELPVVMCITGVLHGFDASAAQWSQNLDAKLVELPLGLKFAEVYEGAARPAWSRGMVRNKVDSIVDGDTSTPATHHKGFWHWLSHCVCGQNMG